MGNESKVTIKIPRQLYNNLKDIIDGTGFNSVTDFIVYVLRDLVSNKDILEKGELSKAEVDAVRKRLKTLGYL